MRLTLLIETEEIEKLDRYLTHNTGRHGADHPHGNRAEFIRQAVLREMARVGALFDD